MTLWTEICDLVGRNQVTRLADRLVTLTEEERAELGGRLPGLVKELRRVRAEEVRARHPDDFEEMASWEVGDLLDELAGALLRESGAAPPDHDPLDRRARGDPGRRRVRGRPPDDPLRPRVQAPSHPAHRSHVMTCDDLRTEIGNLGWPSRG